MGSFYGGGAIMSGSIGGGGTTNYDALQNTPIKNITGSISKPIIISTLEPGIYNMTGAFKYDNNEQDNYFETSTEVIVTMDTITGEKTSVFEYVENGALKVQVATLGDQITIKDVPMTGDCSCNNFWEQL